MKLSITNSIIVKLTIILFLVMAFLYVGQFLKHYIPLVGHWVSSLGAWAPVGYIVAVPVLASLLVSTDALCFIAGALFPLSGAILAVPLATFLTASLNYLIGHFLAKRKIQNILHRYPKVEAFDSAIAKYGFGIMFLSRLIPFPFLNVRNYTALGSTLE